MDKSRGNTEAGFTVLDYRRRYRSARRRYRRHSGRAPPPLNNLRRYARILYRAELRNVREQQTPSHDYGDHKPLYEDGVWPRVAAAITRRTPESAFTPAESPRQLPALTYAIYDIASYACLAALLQLPDAELAVVLDLPDEIQEARTLDEDLVLYVAGHERGHYR